MLHLSTVIFLFEYSMKVGSPLTFIYLTFEVVYGKLYIHSFLSFVNVISIEDAGSGEVKSRESDSD